MSPDGFDDRASTWDADPATVERARAVARSIAAAVPLDRSMRMLEYGAGTGLVSEGLQDAVGPVTLADTSAGMRKVLQAKVEAGQLVRANILALDLSSEPVPQDRFDLILTVLTLHHIRDIDLVLAKFAELLDPGGYLCIVDLDVEDGSFHAEGFDGHHGFERSEVAVQLESHGFTAIAFADCHQIVRDGAAYPLFLVTGVKSDR